MGLNQRTSKLMSHIKCARFIYMYVRPKRYPCTLEAGCKTLFPRLQQSTDVNASTSINLKIPLRFLEAEKGKRSELFSNAIWRYPGLNPHIWRTLWLFVCWTTHDMWPQTLCFLFTRKGQDKPCRKISSWVSSWKLNAAGICIFSSWHLEYQGCLMLLRRVSHDKCFHGIIDVWMQIACSHGATGCVHLMRSVILHAGRHACMLAYRV